MSATNQETVNGQQADGATRKIRTSAQIKASVKKAAATRARNKAAKAGATTQGAPSTAPTIRPTPLRAVPTAPRANTGTPPKLMADLIETLPAIGVSYSKEQRTAWLKAAEANLDVLYPPIAKAA
jgi:hypothetical protein